MQIALATDIGSVELLGLIGIGAGLLMLVASLLPTVKTLRSLPRGWGRQQWNVLAALIVLFVLGYACLLHGRCRSEETGSPTVALILFGGGLFVLLTTTVAFRTVRYIMRTAEFQREAITDPLMQIFNRRHLDGCGRQEVDRALRYGQDLSVLMIDLDHFKSVNDRYGHHAGDLVLSELGTILSSCARSTDIVARYGGEEVVIVTPSTSLDGAVVLAERVRRCVEDHPFAATDREQPLSCTVSVGVADLRQSGASTFVDLVDTADTCLYEAKDGGRNRVVPPAE